MDQITAFSIFLKIEKGQREGTINTNLKLIKKILAETLDLNASSFAKCVYEMIAKNMSPSYIKQQIIAVKHWGECFNIPELADYKSPKRIKVERRPFVKASFSDEEVTAFLALPNPNSNGEYKNYYNRYEMWIIFYAILFYHGMRTIEIAKLTINDIDFGRNVILAYSKIQEIRLIPISPVVREKLRDYIAKLEGKHLFPAFHKTASLSGIEHVQQNDWNYFFKKQIERLGIKRENLTPYSGRHTYGTRMTEEDVSPFKIKTLMGHKRLETTLQYTHMDLKSLRAVQDNDRLTLAHKTGGELLREIHKTQKAIEEKFMNKVHTLINMSIDGDELHVVFRVRK